MIATPLAIMGAVLHIVSHSLCKIVLFYIAGIFSTVYHTHSTFEAAKIAPHLKFWIALLALSGASIIGIPFMPGSYGKDYMLLSELQTHHYAAIIFLISGSLINIFYIYPIVKAAFFTKNPQKITIKTIPLTMKIAIIGGMVLAALISFYISDLTNFFKNYDV
jgi:multicomponent Na+:H+ antiporter subunit D